MDPSPITVTSVAVIAILVFMAVLACHYLSPKTTSWILSSKEETIRLSKNKLFNANGYLIHSGSDFLLSSSGSFKRFDSVDRDCKDIGQNTTHMPLWNIPQSDIPPQPLRPAPAPIPNSKINEEETEDLENEFITTTTASISQQYHPLIKQSATVNALPNSHSTSNIDVPSLKRNLSTPLNFEIKTSTTATAIPRPTIKRIGTAPNGQLINLSEAAFKIQQKGEEMQRSKSTNPFLNNQTNQTKFAAASPPTSPLTTINEICQLSPTEKPLEMKIPITDDNTNKNPFTTVELPSQENQIINLSSDTVTASATVAAPVNNDAPPKETFINAIFDFINQMPASQNMSLPLNHQLSNTNSEVATSAPADDSGRKAFFQFRNRSFSETEATEIDLKQFCSNSNPFKRKGSVEIQKTTSEEVLSSRNGNIPPFRRQSSVGFGIGRRNSSQTSLDSDKGSLDSIILQRAISCDSVNSESSVLLSDLEQPTPEITGYLCVGLHCDKNTITNQSVDIVVNVMEVKEIAGYTNLYPFDTFVRIYLVPDQANAVQTKVIRDSLTPSFNETFTFQMKRRQGRHSLWFHLYHCGNVHTLIGESELEIDEIVRPLTTWLPLSDSRKQKAKWGELMFSLSYLPTAERLTVVVVKARNLKSNEQLATVTTAGNDIQGIFIKAYLLKDDKKVFKKKTSLKRKDHRCPIFNESMIFSIPPYALNSVHIRLTVMCATGTEVLPLGHVIVGSTTTGKGLRHWHQMLSSLRKPVAMWHILRYASITTNNERNDKKGIFIER